jgi:hypothetical protein
LGIQNFYKEKIN